MSENTVYFLFNPFNKKTYVGFTSDMKRRMNEHRNGKGSQYVCRALQKTFIILATVSGFETRALGLRYEWLVKHAYTIIPRQNLVHPRLYRFINPLQEKPFKNSYLNVEICVPFIPADIRTLCVINGATISNEFYAMPPRV
jgi:predicted GIY-YIG superfamily endonuclease